jgi:hypothetical protein
MRTTRNVLLIVGLIGWLLLTVTSIGSLAIALVMFALPANPFPARTVELMLLPVAVGAGSYWLAMRASGVWGVVIAAAPLALFVVYCLKLTHSI